MHRRTIHTRIPYKIRLEKGNKMQDNKMQNDFKENPTIDYNEALKRINDLMQERNRQLNKVIDALNRIANRI